MWVALSGLMPRQYVTYALSVRHLCLVNTALMPCQYGLYLIGKDGSYASSVWHLGLEIVWRLRPVSMAYWTQEIYGVFTMHGCEWTGVKRKVMLAGRKGEGDQLYTCCRGHEAT